MAELKVVADYGDVCGEGPVWDTHRQQLYWTDAGGHRFYRYDWATRKHECVEREFEVNSFAFNEPGGFVVANNSGFWLWDGSGAPRLLADHVDQAPCQLNDGAADPKGRFIAGSWFYDPHKEYPLGKLFCIDNDGTCHIVDEGFHL